MVTDVLAQFIVSIFNGQAVQRVLLRPMYCVNSRNSEHIIYTAVVS
jgi:hypothetical protein